MKSKQVALKQKKKGITSGSSLCWSERNAMLCFGFVKYILWCKGSG